MHTTNHFFKAQEQAWEAVGEGITRQITGYDASIMMVKVAFEKGAIGALHSHPNTQTTYVASGAFEVTINSETHHLSTGDSFYAPSNGEHGVVCLEAGMLVDVFSPLREDFISTPH